MITVRVPHFDLPAIAASGQCFRLNRLTGEEYLLTALGHCLHLTALADGAVFHCEESEYEALWKDYFDLSTDYGAFLAAIPAEDDFLQRAGACGQGLRILRQEPWEVLVSFIISQRKNIPSIMKSVEALSALCGEKIEDGDTVRCAFPAPQALSELTPQQLAACSLGYRAPYLHAAACMVAEGHLDLKAAAGLPDDALQQALLAVPGVGVKVANCVMLFGYHRLDGFPRDVWINRVIDTVYSGEFPLWRYSGFAGVIQQYLFCYARSGALHELE